MKNNNNGIKTFVAVGIGAALFFVLGRFVAIPSPVPNTNISLQYAVLALLAAMYGPVAGGLIGFIGHTLIDLSWGGSPWWSWVIASAFVGVVVGLFSKKLNLQEGEFSKKQVAFFALANIVAHLLAWILVAPVLDIAIYAEPVKKVFAQGAFAAVSNSITAVVVGGLLVAVAPDEADEFARAFEAAAGRAPALIGHVRDDAQWLVRLVENMLSITRFNEGAVQIDKVPQAAEEIAAEAVGKFKKRFNTLPVRVSVPDELLMVPMDATLIEQVLINLMENAVLHAEGATEIELRIRREGDLAQFSVLDNGAGIEPAVLPKLFEEMFPHAGELRGDGRRSMGIGLSVCMSIVRAHGGTMKAKNRATGGACVSFVLPMGEE